MGPDLVGQFWGLDSDGILKLVSREIVRSQEIQVPPGGHRPMGHRLQQFLPFTQPLHPHLFRHQMLTYLTSKGLTDAQIQLISGHESKKSLEVYQHLSLELVDKAYQDAVQSVGI
jgi:integrase